MGCWWHRLIDGLERNVLFKIFSGSAWNLCRLLTANPHPAFHSPAEATLWRDNTRACRVTAPFSALHIYNNTCLHGSLGKRLGSTPPFEFCLAFHFVCVNNTIGHLWSSYTSICFNSSSCYNISIPSNVWILLRNAGSLLMYFMYLCNFIIA